MLKRTFHAILCEIAACALVALCVLIIKTTQDTFPLWTTTTIGVSALIIWSALTTYAILSAADLIST
jgi:hypothetical protein